MGTRGAGAFWEKGGNVGAHDAIDFATYAAFRGRFVGMFRSPQARVASAYLWFRPTFRQPQPNASAYARRVLGSAVKMLAGQASGLGCHFGDGLHVGGREHALFVRGCGSGVPNVRLALHRLRDGFAFVGLTEEWAISICLFHAMHGGTCRAAEFVNSRPGPESGGSFWARRLRAETTAAVAAAGDDPYDEALHEAARRRFWGDVRRSRLSARKCAAICPSAAAQFVARARRPASAGLGRFPL